MNKLTGIIFIGVLSASTAVNAQQNRTKDSITIAISPVYDSVSNAHRFFLGESYRKLWAAPVRMRILDLQKEHGGMTVLQLGGGMQTRSLRLKSADGREWALRTVQKYPERGLSEKLRKTVVKDIVQDQIATSHPYSALVIPPLADALDIPHAEPEIVYVGDDPGLGEYRKDFANNVYLIENRSPEEFDKTDNTLKAQRKVEEDNDTHIDQKMVLRARLLDFIVGDWDRHEDNWRWAKEEDKKKDEKVYIPVPRDRDKVFYKTSGVFPWVLSHQWLKANLQPYAPEIRAVDQWNFNQRYFDRYFLNALSEKDWREEIKYVQDKLTPELLAGSLKRMPANINAIGGEELLKILIARRASLEKSALDYYRFLAVTLDIPASDKKEYFEIEHKKNGNIELTIHNIKKNGETGRKLYHRTFDAKLTKEIRLYGLAGDDVFEVKGVSRSPIRVRLIGGEGKDKFAVDPDLKAKGKTFIYDRLDEGNEVPDAGLAKLKLANDTMVNNFNKKSFVFDQFGPLFHVNYNLDQGIQAGAGLILQKQGFRKDPYASKQELWLDYSTGRKSFIVTYAGDFKQVIGRNNLKVNATLLGPNNLSNFFGLGNETAFIQDEDDDENEEADDRGMSYYRNRYDYLKTDFQLYRNLGKWTLGGGIATEYYTSSRGGNDERFLKDFNLTNPGEEVFNDRVYAGLIANVKYDSRDNIAIPKKGLYWNTSFLASQQLNRGHEAYGKVETEFRSYLNPGHGGFVIANRIGGGTTVGDPVFFQQMQLGGVHSLRGFHTNRFTGKTMLYYNLDLRMKLFDFTSYIVPGSLGLLGFSDVGRVWQPGQSSDQWHHGYGGGIYLIPADLILIQAAVGFSRESTMPYISIGFNF
ncbi:BamA/TamA family outer membrane protein [Pedobacter sp. MR2016-24]|uniref:BamA/TamA family outer membrane protein n=1 Tax=Pedobacter sp. MR2016-24 TaxID=2994466 RepID=UPI002245DA70|nr:BamA/TamA family outer membrane protein [Pedobacter sp. MR2016-24]MCX2484252.1 BamA/TamA family outer membrane protein [Pedobacter sp. MR2016-24]